MNWNFAHFVKGHSDKLTMMLTIAIVQFSIAVMMVPFLGYPVPEAWIWLSLAAVPHTTYKIALAKAYELGEMTKIYPISRGFSIVLVTSVSMLVFHDELTGVMLLGILIIVLGTFGLSVPENSSAVRLSGVALTLCLGAGLSVAAYTMLDGVGVRVGENATTLKSIATFAAWLFILDGLGMMTFMYFYRGRSAFIAAVETRGRGLLAGFAAFACFWIAIWAFAHAPIALVAVLRETSVLFSLVLGKLFLSEKIGVRRSFFALVTFFGIVILQFS
ncbi:DMT family transporter [Marinobacter sp. LV10R520-4]|uniref:DMT family transporter n=1 Tax=Marinobacter sp. LV10R520-4 TaxID=1761796 RepID=UPI001E5EB1F4|nr:DMT family transporter [Marinobacter sp. LV10R520-4]